MNEIKTETQRFSQADRTQYYPLKKMMMMMAIIIIVIVIISYYHEKCSDFGRELMYSECVGFFLQNGQENWGYVKVKNGIEPKSKTNNEHYTY